MSGELTDHIKKKIICRIYLNSLPNSEWGNSGNRVLSAETDLREDEIGHVIEEMLHEGLIRQSQSKKIELLPGGRSKISVVLAGGTFDILHPGHIDTLEGAKSLGDVLVVSIARNKTVEKMKGRPPSNDEKLRQKLVASCRFVDAAVLGSEIDILETVEVVRPDIIALGYDQHHTEAPMVESLAKRGLSCRVVRLRARNPAIKTTAIFANKDRSGLLNDL